jgi:hypothetical protein
LRCNSTAPVEQGQKKERDDGDGPEGPAEQGRESPTHRASNGDVNGQGEKQNRKEGKENHG